MGDCRLCLILALVVVAGYAWGDCQISTLPSGANLISAVYGPTTINYGTDLVNPKPPVTTPVEHNEAIITNPSNGTYRVVDLPSRAIDVEKSPLFIKNKSFVGGPFFVAGILNDTLRVAKGDAYDYGYGLKLHDRYEGRTEISLTQVGTEAGAFMQTLLGILHAQPRISNVIRANDFTVTITCSSPLCDKRAYSLFTRYMNLGASAQMFTELLGSGMIDYVLPESWKLKIVQKVKGVQFKLATKLKNHKLLRELLRLPDLDDLLRNSMKNIDAQEKELILDALTRGQGFHKKTLGSDLLSIEDYLKTRPLKERQSFYEATELLSMKLSEAKTALQKNNIAEFDKIMDNIGEYFGGKQTLSDYVLNNKQSIQSIESRIDQAIENLQVLNKTVGESLPLTTSLYNVLRGYVQRGVSAKTEKGRRLLSEWITPMIYYLVKRGPFTVEQIPGLSAAGFAGFAFLGWRVVGPYPIPKEWTTIIIQPAESVRYQDAFVDFIINHGVDPGDAFKTVMSVTPVCLINSAVEWKTHASLPFLNEMCVTQRSSRVYQPRTAIVGLGIASPTCPTCSMSVMDNDMSIKAGGATASAFVLENAPDKDGSLVVVYAHHTNIKMGDSAEVDLDEAYKEHKTCMQTCPIVRNPVYTLGGLIKDPRLAMFGAAWVQSLVYLLPLPIAAGIDVGILSPQAAACRSCVDDWGGYYIHVYAPPAGKDSSVPSPETHLSDAVGSLLKSLSLDANSVLGRKLEEFQEYLKSAEVKRSAVFANVLLKGMSTGELRFSSILVLWTRAEELMPTGIRNQEGVNVKTPGGTFHIDAKNGVLTFNGQPIMEGDRVRLYVINPRIPGIIFPGKLVYTSFNGDAFTARSSTDYTFTDPSFVRCLRRAFGCDTPNACFGKLVEIHLDTGVVRARSRGFDVYAGDTLVASEVSIHDYTVEARVSKFVEEENKEVNAPMLVFKTGTKEKLGTLESMIFENGYVIRDGARLVVWVEATASVPAGAVSAVHMDWNKEKEGIDVSLQPSPSATREELNAVEKLNEQLRQIGPIRAIDSDRVALAIVKDKNGNLWLRIYDKEQNVVRYDLMRNLDELLSTLVALPDTIKSIETNTWTIRIYRDSQGRLHMSFAARTGKSWDEAIRSIVRDPNDYMAVKIITDKGTHELKAFYKGGKPYLSMDGLSGILVKVIGASVRQELIKSIRQNPNNPGELDIQTDKGTHTVKIEVAGDGTPYLKLDGKDAGRLNTIQGSSGFLWFDPTEGWKLINGALLPLANAFKNGIKISLDADGLVHGEPSSGVVVLSPSQQGQQGLVLPLFDGWEKALLLLLVASMVGVFSLRERA